MFFGATGEESSTVNEHHDRVRVVDDESVLQCAYVEVLIPVNICDVLVNEIFSFVDRQYVNVVTVPLKLIRYYRCYIYGM